MPLIQVYHGAAGGVTCAWDTSYLCPRQLEGSPPAAPWYTCIPGTGDPSNCSMVHINSRQFLDQLSDPPSESLESTWRLRSATCSKNWSPRPGCQSLLPSDVCLRRHISWWSGNTSKGICDISVLEQNTTFFLSHKIKLNRYVFLAAFIPNQKLKYYINKINNADNTCRT